MRIKRTRWLMPVGVVAGALVIMASGCPPAPPPLLSQGFLCTGAPQNFIVPPGVTVVGVHAYGAQGGDNDLDNAIGGYGGKAIGPLAVTPGQALTVIVGCAGDDAPEQDGGYGYGIGGLGQSGESGGGGGASSVTNGSALFVGGGGGGAGGDGPGGHGGFGGHPNGGTGLTNGSGCNGGLGGTQAAPGLGSGGGQDGAGANGGDGDANASGGGGGGGGYFGGGGGGSECGGGGGSSFGPAGTAFENGTWPGDGVVGIFWNAP
jgi:hypothetical protein